MRTASVSSGRRAACRPRSLGDRGCPRTEKADAEDEEAAIERAAGLIVTEEPYSFWAFRLEQVDAADRLGYDQVRAGVRMSGPMPIAGRGQRQGSRSDRWPGSMSTPSSASTTGPSPNHREQGSMTVEGFRSLMSACMVRSRWSARGAIRGADRRVLHDQACGTPSARCISSPSTLTLVGSGDREGADQRGLIGDGGRRRRDGTSLGRRSQSPRRGSLPGPRACRGLPELGVCPYRQFVSPPASRTAGHTMGSLSRSSWVCARHHGQGRSASGSSLM